MGSAVRITGVPHRCPHPCTTSRFFKDKKDPSPTPPPGEDQDTEAGETETSREAMRCRTCGNVITDTAHILDIGSDSSIRTFSNPYGLLYEILTVTRAQGLDTLGPPSTEFTWFPGYAWEIVSCDRCQTHLGWRFNAVSGGTPGVFWGLLRRELVEG